jgi:hypothetical protein
MNAVRVVDGEFLDLGIVSTWSRTWSSRMLTCALAYKSSPPMGANMTPMMKNSGSTVFGVKMGLSRAC